MKRAPILAIIGLTSLLLALPAVARDKHGHGHEKQQEENEGEGHRKHHEEERGFREDERQTICHYVEHFGRQEGKHPRSLPPGLAKKVARGGSLPPGWRDKCVQGEKMPEEVYHECRPLPPELTVQLPPSPMGTVTVAVSGKIVRLVEATREILDVFEVPGFGGQRHS